MPQPKSISPGKGREALWQKVQIFRLNMVRLNRTYYSLLNFTSKIFQNLAFRAKFKQIKQNPLNSLIYSANYAKFAHFVNLFYIMFQASAPAKNPAEFQRIMQIPRNSPTQSTGHAKFAPFANIIHYISDA